ncbi:MULTISPECIES: hypothetical protein [unclassified Ornithinimicrobium]|uniref:hypothetical protein n=1 Tax=unclassified Ornithinimicrobium TaxID=2615080 RepID=UPI003851C15D
MSTTPAARTLFARWIDDAAVFPPDCLPMAQAWHEHRGHLLSGYGDLLGPLLVGASGATSLVDVAAAAHDREAEEPRAVAVGVIARPGTPVEDLVAAVSLLRASAHVRVASVEVAHDDDGRWTRALELGVPVAVEVPRETDAREPALDAVAEAATAGGPGLTVKLRTQSTPVAPVPTVAEVTALMVGARDRGLPFKLTGGLHRAVAHTAALPDGSTEDQHGALNVLVATHHLEEGATREVLEEVLALRDGDLLATAARSLDGAQAAAVRTRFVSFGCCGVTDPISDLAALGLLPA